MNMVTGDYFSGLESRRLTCQLVWSAEQIRLVVDEKETPIKMADLNISSRLDRVPRSIRFPDGSQMLTDNNQAIDELQKLHGNEGRATLAHRLESYIPLVIFSWVAIVGIAAWLYVYAVPVLAESAVALAPAAWKADIGSDIFDQLIKNRYFTDPEITDEQSSGIDQLEMSLLNVTPVESNVTVEFMDSPIFGANAIALPGDKIIMTMDLIELAENDEQLIAIYLHELGHVHHQHALRMALQRSLLALLLVITTGDVATGTDLAVTVPTMLLSLSYSRQFEEQADDFAIERLIQYGISTQHFATIMDKLAARGEGSNWMINAEYLSTHPAPEDRVAKFRAADSK